MAKHERSNTNHDSGHDEDSQYIKNKKHKFFRHWAGVEPIIGYCWSDHRLGAPTRVSSETPSMPCLQRPHSTSKEL